MAIETLVTDQWWQQSIKQGHQSMRNEDYLTATTHYIRSLIQVEHIIKLKRQAAKNHQIAVKMKNTVCLNSMYVCSCHNVSSAFSKRNEWETAQRYLETALHFIQEQIEKVGFYPSSDRCVDQLYQLCLRKMSQFLLSRGVSEQEARHYLLSLDAPHARKSIS